MSYSKLYFKNPFRAPVFRAKETSSTMCDAVEFIFLEQADHGTLLFALSQTDGRGRVAGRRWVSPVGESLLATVIFDCSALTFPVGVFPLLAGVAVARMIEREWGIGARVKWPNDVIVDGRKVAGILCECRNGKILCGVGLNLNQRVFDPTQEFRSPPVSIRQLTGKRVSVKGAARLLLDSFFELLGGDWRVELDRLLLDVGKVVSFMPGDPNLPGSVQVLGTFLGLSAAGLVCIETQDGVLEFICGEFC